MTIRIASLFCGMAIVACSVAHAQMTATPISVNCGGTETNGHALLNCSQLGTYGAATVEIGVTVDSGPQKVFNIELLFTAGTSTLTLFDNTQAATTRFDYGNIKGAANVTGGTGTFQGVSGSLNYQLTGLGTEKSSSVSLSGSASLFFDLSPQMPDQTAGLQMAQNQIVMDTAQQQGAQQDVQMVTQDTVQNETTTSNKTSYKWDLPIPAGDSTGPAWGSVSPSSDTLQPDQSVPLTITADPTGLDPGIYQADIDITSTPFATAANPNPPSTTQTVSVTMIVGTGQPASTLSQTGLQFTGATGGPKPPQQPVQLSVTGTSSLPYSTKISTLSGGNWLSIPAGASGIVSPASPATIQVQVDPSQLGIGDYNGLIAVAIPGASNSPQTIQVVLHILPVVFESVVSVAPRALAFNVPFGSAGQPQTIEVDNASTDPIGILTIADFNATSDTPGTAPPASSLPAWFTITQSAPTAVAEQPVTLTVAMNPAGLAEGVYLIGTIEVITSDEIAYPVDVTLTITPPSTATAPEARAAVAPCVATTLRPVFTLLGDQFQTQAAQPVSLEGLVYDDCGNPLTGGTVSVSSTPYDSKSPADHSVSMVSTGNGKWAGTWLPLGVNGGIVTATLTAATSAGLVGSTSIIGTVAANTTAPMIADGGVVSAAAFAPHSPIAPGSFVSIFGSNLAIGLKSSTSYPLAGSLGGTQVTLGGEILPLQFVSAGQINVLIPYDVPTNTTQQLQVTQNGLASLSQTVFVAAAQPAVFTQDQSGTGAGVIVVIQPDGAEFLVTPSAPATAGDALAIYCAGLGVVSPAVPAGTAAPLSSLTKATNPISVTIGGQPAQVLFAGLAPGFSGLYQINVVAPAGVSAGSSVPVVVTAAGVSSTAVTIAIQ
jgi:uncharacterized protein (TIGR03437 family)